MTDDALQQKRLIAAAIDIGIGCVLGGALWIFSLVIQLMTGMILRHDSMVSLYLPRVLHFLIVVVILAYILGRDMLGNGRSLGKKTQDLRVVTAAGAPITIVDSVKRNAIFAIGWALELVSATLQLVPCLGDAVACLMIPLLILGGLAGLAAAVVEIIKITQEPDGKRFGDQLAGTRVQF